MTKVEELFTCTLPWDVFMANGDDKVLCVRKGELPKECSVPYATLKAEALRRRRERPYFEVLGKALVLYSSTRDDMYVVRADAADPRLVVTYVYGFRVQQIMLPNIRAVKAIFDRERTFLEVLHATYNTPKTDADVVEVLFA